MLTWASPNERYYYQHGLDRGVLYLSNPTKAVPFNGLVGFDEGDDGGETSLLYRDGVVYMADAEPGDFTAKMTTISYPDEFGECVGIPQVTDGLFVDNQKPKPFGFSYRTLVGSGTMGDLFGYQIHLVYGCLATIGQRQRKTIGSDTTPVEFNFNIVCTPVKLSGYRPTAHYIIDTRNMSKSTVAELEAILYGSDTEDPRLPHPQELYDLMNFGTSMTATLSADGNTYTVSGSYEYLEETGANTFVMSNINGADNGDGTYVISDGGNTDVITE